MPRFGNLQDIWNKLDEILGQISGGGGSGFATEAKQDDIILELQNILAEVELAATEDKQDDIIAELQIPSSLATQTKQTEQIDLLTSIDSKINGGEDSASLNNIDLNTAGTIDVLKFIAEQQVITNKYLRKIYNPK